MELRTVIARTVWRFEMRLVPGLTVGDVGAVGVEEGRKVEFGLKDRWQAEKEGPLVRFRRRVGGGC